MGIPVFLFEKTFTSNIKIIQNVSRKIRRSNPNPSQISKFRIQDAVRCECAAKVLIPEIGTKPGFEWTNCDQNDEFKKKGRCF